MSLKLSKKTWGYFECKNQEERDDMMALCELLGLKRFDSSVKICDFKIAPNVLINGSGNTFQECCAHSFPCDYQASEFIKDNF